eukprot:CAMPEP_0203748728 /NCGR_PEP_ID=MMETSP0098-20131031/3540_1 /ASSEMBLY_ACC=CAM_ASM_000208 /TAXON_ID=96639 /ORGANISM=" , Strain NY0313808BC1" /LENGTH=449 /DNA_ID=CAMNT_0050637587 /DNA_START=477 /DNA_END=1823 /DNA_ORIENTATION=-
MSCRRKRKYSAPSGAEVVTSNKRKRELFTCDLPGFKCFPHNDVTVKVALDGLDDNSPVSLFDTKTGKATTFKAKSKLQEALLKDKAKQVYVGQFTSKKEIRHICNRMGKYGYWSLEDILKCDKKVSLVTARNKKVEGTYPEVRHLAARLAQLWHYRVDQNDQPKADIVSKTVRKKKTVSKTVRKKKATVPLIEQDFSKKPPVAGVTSTIAPRKEEVLSQDKNIADPISSLDVEDEYLAGFTYAEKKYVMYLVIRELAESNRPIEFFDREAGERVKLPGDKTIVFNTVSEFLDANPTYEIYIGQEKSFSDMDNLFQISLGQRMGHYGNMSLDELNQKCMVSIYRGEDFYGQVPLKFVRPLLCQRLNLRVGEDYYQGTAEDGDQQRTDCDRFNDGSEVAAGDAKSSHGECSKTCSEAVIQPQSTGAAIKKRRQERPKTGKGDEDYVNKSTT